MSEEVKRYGIDHRGYAREGEDGEWVRLSDHLKLLAKYNGVFEWVYKIHREPYDDPKGLKDLYEDSLK